MHSKASVIISGHGGGRRGIILRTALKHNPILVILNEMKNLNVYL